MEKTPKLSNQLNWLYAGPQDPRPFHYSRFTCISDALGMTSTLYVEFIEFREAYDFVPHRGLFFEVLQLGMHGRLCFSCKIYSMHELVQSVVHFGGSCGRI